MAVSAEMRHLLTANESDRAELDPLKRDSEALDRQIEMIRTRMARRCERIREITLRDGRPAGPILVETLRRRALALGLSLLIPEGITRGEAMAELASLADMQGLREPVRALVALPAQA